ncbi:MAG TPA: hypothetical protein VM409_00365 [Chloroflexia bacterium]|nr:hypothetical protein [Chloroflexia bacterium]
MSGLEQDERLEALKELPPLLPRFLLRRRLGLPVVPALMQELGLDRSTFFLLPQIQQVLGSHGDKPVTLAQIKHYYPYHLTDPFTPGIALLKEKGLVDGDPLRGLSFTERGRWVIERLHTEGKEYVGRIEALPDAEAEALVGQLGRAVESILISPALAPQPGRHLAGSRSITGIGDTRPVMVRIEQAVYDLWMARDDAHEQAWRDAEMEGPAMVAWTLLWNGEAATLDELALKLGLQHDMPEVESILAYLFEREYVQREGGRLQLTPEGILAREDIERETDRIYFTPWPHSTAEAIQVRGALEAVVDRLPSPAA